MLKQKITGSVQEVILPDFPDDDDNTVTTTVTKSRRVSFGPNFVKEFIVDSAISAQCMPEYEQPFPSSDSSNADSSHSAIASHSAISHGTSVLQENVKLHKMDADTAENRPKPPKFASTICFSADSPTADMEFTEGCITLAKSILDKKNKEMTVFIQAKPKGPKEEEKTKEEETNYFEGSQFEMSMTQCLKSKEKKREEKRFGKYEDEMSMTRCERFFEDEDESKENRMPLDAIMRYLDRDESDSDLFNPEKSFTQLLGVNNSVELSDVSEQLNLNESMEMSGDLNIPVGTQEVESEEEASEKMVVEEMIVEKMVLRKLVTEETTSEMMVVEETSAKKTIRTEMLVRTPEEMLCEKIADEDVIGERITEEIVAPEKMVPEEMACQKITAEETSPEDTITEDLMDVEPPGNPTPFVRKTTPVASQQFIPQEDDGPSEPSLGDLKVIESLKEQAKEKGCEWSLRDVQHPQRRSQGLISFGCRLLDSTTSLRFSLKMSGEDALDSCSLVTDSSILLDEERGCRLPEYTLAVGFGFDELRKYFSALQGVATLRHVPYYMDRVNSFLSKMNAYLRQIHAILTSYPGSRLNGCRLSFRLFSFPMFCSCVVSIDLSNVFRLSRASLLFSHDFGCLDERKVGEIFEESLKGENSLCEFVVRSTRYLVEQERQSGYLSKRTHIRLLPDELKS